MSHHIKIERPKHINKDGSESSTKRDYRVKDRKRKGSPVVGVVTSQKACDDLVHRYRITYLARHFEKHPNDLAFYRKQLKFRKKVSV